jgi:hypothetical protein
MQRNFTLLFRLLAGMLGADGLNGLDAGQIIVLPN